MKRVISLTLALCVMLSAASYAASPVGAEKFRDLKGGEWFYPYVDQMTKDGIITGATENTFEPSKEVTGAEFVTFVIRAADGYKAGNTSGHWAKGYMDRAYQIGITTRDEMPAELWDKPISRQSMARIIARGTELIMKEKPAEDTEKYTACIPDWDDVCTVCKPYVAQAYAKGIFTGTDSKGTFNGAKTMTRGETACVIAKLLDPALRNEVTIVNGDGTMKMGAAEMYITRTLDNTRFYKENGKYYISCVYPDDLPEGFEMRFTVIMERNDGPVLQYKTFALRESDMIPKTGSFTREFAGLKSLNSIDSIILNITVDAPNSTISDYRKCEGAMGALAEFKNGKVTY